ncbi:hypothetical protein Enr13x_75750 [Stieleria neptunia]|uniref:Uncharacterized protein n=1 Tax=Stieleria neptunia TaxID=2527979 RepID=A0A518I3L3_9BACT|nr:hypothetical protein [Stieleria neptunia]QDV47664.1 hypothetical protein Enr13x_75750 [Stieleria neptunia]
MSTVAPPVTPSKRSVDPSQGTEAAKRTAAEQLIEQRIDEARRALWWSELTRTGLMVVIGSMLALLVWLVVDHWVYSPGPIVRSASFAALVTLAGWFLIRRAWPVMTSRVTREYAAWALEQDHPDYRQQLTSYVTLNDGDSRRGVRVRVLRAIGTRAASLLKSHDVLPREATGTFKWWITAAAVFALLAAYCVGSPKSSLASAKRLAIPLAAIDPARRVEIRDVLPGDAEALAGRDLKISADVDGLRDGEAVVCRWSTDGTPREAELELDPSSNRFVGTLSLDHAASGIVRYSVQAGDAVAGPFELSVQNVPVVAIESVRYQPPAYTRQKPRTTSSPAITAIDGTKIRITAKTNRPIARAELQFNPKALGDTVRATAGRTPIAIGDDGVTLTSDVTLRCARGKTASVELESFRIRVWDSNEQANPDPIIYPIKVIADLPPEVAIVVPKKSPIEVPVGAQQIIEVHAMDADFELQRVTLRIERGIDTLEDPVIWVKPDDGNGKGNQVMEYRFRPLEHLLRAGDVVRISATAIDNRNIPGDPNVQPNQATTDPIEIRIVEDAEPLPQDPTGNDGLSAPDDRPASDVEQSQQGEGQQSSGGEGAQGQGGQSQGDPSQGSEGQSSGGEGSGGSESSGENQDPSDGEQGGSSPQQPGEQSSGEGATGQSGTESQSPTDGQPGSSDPSDPGGQSPAGEPTDPNSTDPNSSDPPSSPSTDQQPEGQSPANDGAQDAQGTQGTGQSDGSMQDAGDGSGTSNPNGSEPNSTDGADSSSGEGDSSSSDSAGSESQSPSGGEPSKAPPEHDGQAFERIKDYLEKQKQNQSRDGSPADRNQPPQNEGSAGDSESADEGAGDTQSPKSDAGEQESSQGKSAGEQAAGEEQSGSGDSSQSDPDNGQQGTDEQAAGEQGTGEQGSGEQGSGEQGSGEQGSGEQGSGEQESGAAPDGGKPEGQDPGGSESGDPKGQPDPASGSKGESGSREGADSPDPSGSSQSGDPPPGQSPSPPSPDASSGSQGSGTGTSPDAGDAAAEPPPPPDLEYAKKATDMVLDYLDETRDQVDEDLLKELDWTEQDLQRFRERWEKVRELDQPTQPAGSTNELQDALRSLGLQPSDSPAPSTRDAADSLRNLRDSGNRRQAPPAIRDAFDAFRRRK